MKQILKYIALPFVAVILLSACHERYVTYSDAEYVMFADTLSTYPVQKDVEWFAIPVVSTVIRDYDRTFGVEIIDKGSNAIEGVHYTLESNSITIPAGEMATEVRVRANYEKIEATDSLGFVLRLVMPEQLEWDLYPNGAQTKVVMYKSCPFDENNFTGWCVMTSLLLYDYPGLNPSYQRLVRSELHPTIENAVIVRNCFYDGYDVTLHFDASNPAQPRVTMDEDEVLSDEASVFGMIHGDNKLLGTTPTYQPSFYNSCQRFVELWLSVYVKNLGEMVGTVGTFYNIFEWVSDEEAERLQREEGM